MVKKQKKTKQANKKSLRFLAYNAGIANEKMKH